MPSNDPINISRSAAGEMRGRLNCSDKEGSEGRKGTAECGSGERGEWGRVSKRLVNCHDAQSLMEEGEFRGVTVKFRLTLTMKHMHYFLRMADISTALWVF